MLLETSFPKEYFTQNMNITAQLVGIGGIVLSLLSFQFAKRKHIMLCQMAASLLFSTQLFMVGAITGGCLDLISFVRTVIFSNNGKNWAKSKLWLFGFLALMVITGLFTWKDGWSILPIIGSCLSTIALWMTKEKHMRLVSLTVGPCWLVYNLVTGAYTGALNEVLAMTSIVISLIRNDIPARRKGQ